MDINAFWRLTGGRPKLRAPAPIEQTSITTAILHMPSPNLAQIADDRLKSLLTAAISVGGGVLMIGMAPSDLEISGECFTARCDVRLTNSSQQLSVLIEGDIDNLGRVAPRAASVLG